MTSYSRHFSRSTPPDAFESAGELLRRGPVVEVRVTVPPAHVSVLRQTGASVPDEVSGLALIDTGSTTAAVDEDVLLSLGAQQIGYQRVSTGGGTIVRPAFAAQIIPSPPLPVIRFVACTALPLRESGLVAVIGRDYLTRFVFTYDGRNGEIALSW